MRMSDDDVAVIVNASPAHYRDTIATLIQRQQRIARDAQFLPQNIRDDIYRLLKQVLS